MTHAVEVEDTYAEAFKSLYVEFLITARDRKWLDHAIHASTGYGSSSIRCDCEAGLDRYVGPGSDESFPTPDGRPGAICQLHVPRFWKNRVEALEKALLSRVSQNVLTCPTTRCFSLSEVEPYYRLGGNWHSLVMASNGLKIVMAEKCGSFRRWAVSSPSIVDFRTPTA